MRKHYIDTHCHFDFSPFIGDESDSLRRAVDVGICQIIVPSVDVGRFPAILRLAERYSALLIALGLHPIAIARHDDTALTLLELHLQRPHTSLVAIGEIGLDLFMDNPQFARQQVLLDAQLRLAKRYNLPVILHSRRTHDKLAVHLKGFALPRTGVGGTITYPRARKTREVIARLPLDSLLLETDAPDMPLNGFQGQPNRPEYVVQIFEALCALRTEPPALIADTLLTTTRQLFTF